MLALKLQVVINAPANATSAGSGQTKAYLGHSFYRGVTALPLNLLRPDQKWHLH